MAKGNLLDLFDKDGTRLYETGVANCALFVYDVTNSDYGKTSQEGGVCWNGITSISESPSGAEANPIYADNMKYLNLFSAEEFGATIEAYTYPDEFALCDGSAELVAGAYFGQQPRKMFGLAYKTKEGNDVVGEAYSEKLHIIYGAKASPSEKQYQTINDSPEAITFSWELTTTPVKFTIDGVQYNTANIVVDKAKVGATKYAALEKVIYGEGDASTGTGGYLPLPDEVKTILQA